MRFLLLLPLLLSIPVWAEVPPPPPLEIPKAVPVVQAPPAEAQPCTDRAFR